MKNVTQTSKLGQPALWLSLFPQEVLKTLSLMTHGSPPPPVAELIVTIAARSPEFILQERTCHIKQFNITTPRLTTNSFGLFPVQSACPGKSYYHPAAPCPSANGFQAYR